VTSSGVTFVPNFMKIGQPVYKLAQNVLYFTAYSDLTEVVASTSIP
jgi:hypothetical protein